ncbi:C-type cytochrome biogenesis membrane protein [Rhodovulum sulfidophilum]|uniref:C-type cytochrome biogenesis membrane protein n=1 Tax=Rhodovulum sulfidophilum TaxID=35806 RepID=A0A0D6AWX9_RHOSU|nr:hypothetical protein [Rhodovulum sulfidophilum]MCE8418561.1 hypothetical protein [Rhodovulum sulfidophilum]MCE8438678.1 hypothetical protein [Rhodovulum sulfidophilum]MCE8471903.1 hypothetical protein [Rhodovulum sulfidophilum]BAQ67216.1 C-type cytochrome biogenesis membrane protein [Rhodovulum sulfidophilum]BAQ71244.1 C-type cytochrome biogenesis membrane protein [Rhodovulum sulfidophilum]
MDDVFREYYKRFGDLPSSRRMPDEVLGKLDELCAMAVARGRKLTDEELELAPEPPLNAMS